MCSLPKGLQHKLGHNSGLSAGQKQLLCLARALLRQSKIVVLDEITSSVDVNTGQLIMETVKKEFASSTVFVIAHKLNTILDCDK